MACSSKIIELKALLAAKHPAFVSRPDGYLPTGLAQADAALHGGLPRGGLTEIVCPHSGGLLLRALIHSTLQRQGLMALIDGGDSFDSAGVSARALQRLLWVRGKTTAQVVQAADLLLRDGNLTLVIADLRSNSPAEIGQVPTSSWYRLQKVVEPTATVFAVLTRQPLIGAARPRLTIETRFALDAFERRQTDLMNRLHASLARSAAEPMERYA